MPDLVDAVANGNSLSETAGRINGGEKPARPGTWVLMVIRSVVKPSAYFDSVTLMLVQREVRQLPDVEEAGAVMGTDANKELLRDAGLLTSEAQAARPDDLILAVRAGSGEVAFAALRTAETLLVQRRETAATGTYRPKTVASAVRMLPGANLALISVPGRFAAGVARDALAAGLHVMLFSDNVTLDAEIELKQTATARGLLMMGPDCGTAIIGGTGLGFANRVRRGTIGIVGAAGTGIQEVASLVHRGGAGISHAIGTGGGAPRPAGGGVPAAAGGFAPRSHHRAAGERVLSHPPPPRLVP